MRSARWLFADTSVNPKFSENRQGKRALKYSRILADRGIGSAGRRCRGVVVHTVVVCDAEPVAIAGVRSVLEASGVWTVSAAESSLAPALQAVRDLAPSLLLVDKAFGIYAVMDCLKDLLHHRSPTATVVWGMSLPEVEALRFLQAGARGVM